MISAYSQIEFGLKGGLHSIELGKNPISIFQDTDNNGTISFVESSYGVHAGLFTRIKLLGLFVEPGFLFNSTSIDYRLSGTNEGGDFTELHKESFKNIDVPFMVGMKFLIFDVFGGPVAHIKIDRAADIIDVESYGEKIDAATYGFQAGFGLSIGNIKAQIAYEGNLSKFGEVISVGDSKFMVDEKAARMLFSIGYKF
jgi:hypothetical protein